MLFWLYNVQSFCVRMACKANLYKRTLTSSADVFMGQQEVLSTGVQLALGDVGQVELKFFSFV